MLWMPHPRDRELVSTGVLKLHRTPGLHRQDRGDRLGYHFLLVAETSADTRLDDVDIADRDVERKGNHPAAMVRDLGAGSEDQALVLVEERNGDVRLEAGVLLILHVELVLHYEIGIVVSPFHITHLDIDMGRDVASRVVDPVA